MKRLRVSLLPPGWDARVHRRVTPLAPIYTPGWRETLWSKAYCPRKQHDDSVRPRTSDPEIGSPGHWPLCHHGKSWKKVPFTMQKPGGSEKEDFPGSWQSRQLFEMASFSTHLILQHSPKGKLHGFIFEESHAIQEKFTIWPASTKHRSQVKGRCFTNSRFSHDVTAAMLEPLNKETAAMLEPQPNPPGIQLYYYANVFFCFRWKTWLLIMWVQTNFTESVLNIQKS